MNRRIRAFEILTFLSLSALIGGLRVAIRNRPVGPRLPSVSLGLPVQSARLLALSFESVAADLLWIRFVQDVPTNPADAASGDTLATELRAITALDPTFRAPYVHGTVLLSVLGNQPCAALDVLENGIPRFPLDWRLSFQAGYECFSELGDMECAQRHMQRAASMPGSPKWLPGLVARFLAVNRRGDAAVEYLQSVIATTRDERLRAQFEERLKQARLSAALEVIDRGLREYRIRHQGALPDSLDRLVSEGILAAIPPEDPVGGHFVLGSDGHARSSTGAGILGPVRIEGGLANDVLERLLPQRIEARAAEMIGHPVWLHFESDRVASAGGLLDFAVQALSLALQYTESPTDRQSLQVFFARSIMAHDVDRLKKTQIEMLRTTKSGAPSIAEIVAAAGIPDHDPFGTPYVIDSTGVPSAGTGRHPMVNVRGRGAARCR